MAQLQALQVQVQHLAAQVEQLTGQNQALQAQNQALAAQNQALTAQNQALQAQVQQLTAQNQALQAQVQQLTAQNQALQAQIQREFNLPPSIIENKACPVCLDDLQPGMLTRTPCWHIFHERCLVDSRQMNGRCAVCRTVILTGCFRIRVLDASRDPAGE